MLPSLDIVNKVLFPAPKSTYTADDFPDELIWVPKGLNPQDARPEDFVPCLLLTAASARFFILYCHSNAEDLGRVHSFCSILRAQFQVHVLAVEYPGYGICPGQADEASVMENAMVALNFLRHTLRWSMDEILIMGRSIGCCPALHIASRFTVYGLILIAPFTSVRELFREYLGRFADFIDERFPNKDLMKTVNSPLLLVHGRQDTVVPWTHGQALYGTCRARKRFVIPECMKHNTNLLTEASYFVLPMLQFFGLPDYTFEDLIIPAWAFTKRLPPGNDYEQSCLLPTSDVFRSSTARPRMPPRTGSEEVVSMQTFKLFQQRQTGSGDGVGKAVAAGRGPSEQPPTPEASLELPKSPVLELPSARLAPRLGAMSEVNRPPPPPPPDPDDEPTWDDGPLAPDADGVCAGAPSDAPDVGGLADAAGRRHDHVTEPSQETADGVTDADEVRDLESAAAAAMARFLEMQAADSRLTRFDTPEAKEEEVLFTWPTTSACSSQRPEASAAPCEEEPPDPPEDSGFFKVPASRGGPGAANGTFAEFPGAEAIGCGPLFPSPAMVSRSFSGGGEGLWWLSCRSGGEAMRPPAPGPAPAKALFRGGHPTPTQQPAANGGAVEGIIAAPPRRCYTSGPTTVLHM
mmetsp:Transcript_125457/g.360554  ORF Transcript_125457/g.360554 Transcript_125457/m.360554 type:complete len:634 (-) Transcript_125457:61-1962(-)